MLEKLIKYWPLLSVAALAIVSVFTIGYFSKVGLHFLGVMDFTNFIYSFSFIFALLAASLGIYFWGDYLEKLVQMAEKPNARSTLRKFMLVNVALFIAVLFLPAVLPEKYIRPGWWGSDRILAIMMVLLSVWLLASAYIDLKTVRKVSIGSGFYTAVVLLFTLYYVGRAVADHQMFVAKEMFTLTPKEGSPVTGKIIRSSSSGFLMFVDNRVAFFPNNEIRQVRAVEELKRE